MINGINGEVKEVIEVFGGFGFSNVLCSRVIRIFEFVIYFLGRVDSYGDGCWDFRVFYSYMLVGESYFLFML